MAGLTPEQQDGVRAIVRQEMMEALKPLRADAEASAVAEVIRAIVREEIMAAITRPSKRIVP